MSDKSASQQIDKIIDTPGGWKGDLLKQLRQVILSAADDITEEVKWKMKTRPDGLPVWSHNGIVCFAEIWKDNIKLLFPHGAELKKSQNYFNARLKSKDIRAIEYKEDSKVNKNELKIIVDEAVALNQAKLK